MWTLQSTSTHKGPRGHVFSPLFKMERANLSLVVCDGNRNHSEYLCVCVCLCLKHECVYVCINYSDMYVHRRVCVWFVHVRCTGKIRGQNNAFSASKYHDCSIYCLYGFDKSRSLCLTLYWEILTNVQTNMLIFNEHVMNELHWFCVWSQNNRDQDKC